MTLFRKVFQNQSTPASHEDTQDEAALRSALTDAEDTSVPLVLDPFEHMAAQQTEAGINGNGSGDLTEVTKNLYDMDFEDENPGSIFLPQDTPVAKEDSEESVTPLAADEELIYQTDEEIAACLDRAMAAPVPEEFKTDTAADMDAEPEPSIEQTAVVSEADDEPAEEPDVARFAQEQMASLNVAGADTEDAAEATDDESVLDLSGAANLSSVATPSSGRAGRRVGRVKTRLLGFNRTGDVDHDPIGQAPEATATAQREKYPVGWLVIVEGPGVGHSFSIFTGASMIGRGEEQVIRLDFGDNSISRNNHAAIAYDEEQNKFYIGHGGKSNIIRRNARPVLSTEELNHADLIRIGETTLRFVALCGSDFQWNMAGDAHDG